MKERGGARSLHRRGCRGDEGERSSRGLKGSQKGGEGDSLVPVGSQHGNIRKLQL
jgi:hypothetical protein